jgi:CheY-like chemotaxis protein
MPTPKFRILCTEDDADSRDLIVAILNSTTPILFYSGAAFDKDKKQAQECGAQGYLTKPANGDELVAEVFRLVAAFKLPLTNPAQRETH